MRLAASGMSAGAAAALVGAAAVTGAGRAIDRRLFAAGNAPVGGPRVDRFFRGVTEFGAIAASGTAAVVLAVSGRRRPALDAFGAAAATWAIGQVAKRATRRPRPSGDPDTARVLIDPPTSTSWPSTHPAVLLAFVTVAGRDLDLPGPARGALTALGGLVGLSRIRNGVHWPSDVASGLLLGRACANLWSAVRGARRAA